MLFHSVSFNEETPPGVAASMLISMGAANCLQLIVASSSCSSSVILLFAVAPFASSSIMKLIGQIICKNFQLKMLLIGSCHNG